VVKAGEELDVKILRVDTDERKIGLSLKRAQWGEASDTAQRADKPGAPQTTPSGAPAKGGMDEHGALGTDKIEL
jgi:small subunit ribosomal protein S1